MNSEEDAWLGGERPTVKKYRWDTVARTGPKTLED